MSNNVTIFAALGAVSKAPSGVSLTNLHPTAPASGGWWPVVRESFTGAWQRNVELHRDHLLANWAVWSCLTRIAGDIGKLRLRLVAKTRSGQWEEATSNAFSPVLRKPNRFQTRQKFIESWLISKLSHGNAYVLKERDQRGVVVALYVLDPQRVRPLVAPDGSVYYAIGDDWLAGLDQSIPAIPASEIIHDVAYALFHPLCGLPPLFACSMAAAMGSKILENSARFFANSAQPGGILTAPEQISDEIAQRIKEHWESNYVGSSNAGKVAVLGDGITYAPLAQNAVDSETVDQLKLSGEMVCSTFHVPAWKVGMQAMPTGQKVGDLNQIYYEDCLQELMEAIEELLDFGLGLDTPKEGVQYGTEFNLDDLIKMDEVSQITMLNESVKGGWMMPDEARARRNLPPVQGGDTPYMQQQNFALSDLAKRSQLPNPFAAATPPPPPPAPPAPEPDEGEEPEEDEEDADTKAFADALIKRLTATAEA
jgi:HK97 family phage portal protein